MPDGYSKEIDCKIVMKLAKKAAFSTYEMKNNTHLNNNILLPRIQNKYKQKSQINLHSDMKTKAHSSYIPFSNMKNKS